MDDPSHISILGGGIAGLAVGYYATRRNLPFTLYEAGEQVGGNAVTFSRDGFAFDSGAHRFHAQDPEITQDVRDLLGSDLVKLAVPSQIYHAGRLIDFPLSPLNLARSLGLGTCLRAAGEKLRAPSPPPGPDASFEAVAIRTYGRTVADLFLLNYSEKLWGVPCRRLSPAVAGRRLRGLHLGSFIREALLGRNAKVEHLDGSFQYPREGIGMIARRLEEACGSGRLLTRSRITRILHGQDRVQAVEINGDRRLETAEVVSTLPLPLLAQLLEPPPPQAISDLVRGLRYRDVILVTFLLDRKTVMRSATVYFPDPEVVFTRVSEPKNRSASLAPADQTSLMVEVPCTQGDALSQMGPEGVAALCRRQLAGLGWIREDELLGVVTARLPFAYPILELGTEDRVARILAHLERFRNLRLSGRAGLFAYTHIHDLLRAGKQLVEAYPMRAGPGLEVERAGRISQVLP